MGERGGFITRLRRGTYAPHIIEHVALELQLMIGHDVGYGKTRGGDVAGEYTLVFEHVHSGITGGGPRHETRDELLRLGVNNESVIVDVAPGYILQAGLPYSRSEFAIVLDAEPTDVPERYRDPERARQLVSVLADAVWRDGIVIAPAKEWEVQDRARDVGCRVAVFATDNDITARDKKVAHSAGSVDNGRIVLECGGTVTDAGPLRDDAPAAAQVAATLAMFTIQELKPNLLAGAANAGGGMRGAG